MINETVADVFAENDADASSLAALASLLRPTVKELANRWLKDAESNLGKMTTVSVSGGKWQTAAVAAATGAGR